ncbi:lipoprotein [Legionella cardiaca]|uniref:Lipoprotein n=1 Tax=Legionella cardiaca TaxID=1071983 RepID=A0ABY8ASU4_9GAMM|nr:lipoprotein [Legionella cardiaca]WED42580.1 lipoprotein [Legionella cardiaca]
MTVLTLSACGQKGPLYLPQPEQQQQHPNTANK